MSSYQRLISYIYAYEGGVKGKNVGYAKIDVRSGQCKIAVSVKKVYVGSNDIGVYLLASGGREIYLGNIFIRNGCGEFRAICSEADMEGQNFSMDQCHGLTIHDVESAWQAYTTIWEDAVAHAAEIELAEVTSQNRLQREEQEKAKLVSAKAHAVGRDGGKAVAAAELSAQAPSAQVSSAQVAGVQAPGTQASGVQVPGTQASGARVSGTQVSGTRVSGTQVSGTRASGTQVSGAGVSDTQVSNAQVSNAQVPGTQIAGAQNLSAQSLSAQSLPVRRIFSRNSGMAESKREVKNELKAEAKPDLKPDIKANVKPELKSEQAGTEERGRVADLGVLVAAALTADTTGTGKSQGRTNTNNAGRIRSGLNRSGLAGSSTSSSSLSASSMVGSGTASSSRAGAGTVSSSRVGVGTAGSSRAGAGTAGPNQTGAGTVSSSRAGVGTAGSNRVGAGTASSSMGDPSRGNPNAAGQTMGNPSTAALGTDNPTTVGRGMGGYPNVIPPGMADPNMPHANQNNAGAATANPETVRTEANAANTNMAANQPDCEPGTPSAAPPGMYGSGDKQGTEPASRDGFTAIGAQDPGSLDAEAIWDNFQRMYPKLTAFDYEHGCEIVSIQPQDLGLLPREIWVFGNNSFLLHGYYNYRYLILAKLCNPDGPPRFLLGVPGHYYSNEKYMASMFGFPNFVLSKQQPPQDDRFGYWYTDIRI